MPRPDPLLLTASAAVIGGGWVAAPECVLAGTVAALAIVIQHGLSFRVALFMSLAVAISAERAKAAVASFHHDMTLARRDVAGPKRCAGRVTVTRSPEWKRDAMQWEGTAVHLDCEGQTVAGVRLGLRGGPLDLARNEAFFVIAQLAPKQVLRNPGLPGAWLGSARRGVVLTGRVLHAERLSAPFGVRSFIDGLRAHAREQIETGFPRAARPLARALVLGENDLEEEDRAAFRESGLAHLLAVSGTHLVFAVVALVTLTRRLLVRWRSLSERVDVGRWAAALGVPLAIFYADFSGGSGSAWRAAWMLAGGYLAVAWGGRPSVSRVVAASMLAGVGFDPLLLFDLSFLLSLAATAGLLVLGRVWVRVIQVHIQSPPLRLLLNSLAVTAASMLACAPLLAVMSGEISLAGLVANIVAGPIGELFALPLCLGYPLLEWVPWISRGVALAGSGALLFVQEVARVTASLEWAQVTVPTPTSWHYAVALLGGLTTWLSPSRRGRVMHSMFAVLALLLTHSATHSRQGHEGLLRVTFVDVGQGDAALIDFPDGTTALIDGGGQPMGRDPGRHVLLPLLRTRGLTHIDTLVLSHLDADHLLGLQAVAEAVSTGAFWSAPSGDDDSGPYRFLSETLQKRGVRMQGPKELCGVPLRRGGATLEVLDPCPGPVDGASRNDNSMVVRIRYGKHSVLFVGDAEAAQEERLLETSLSHSTVLKVGHHGSASSSSEQWLRRISPTLAIVSVGTRNRFGHPNPQVLQRYESFGVQVLRTDQVGGVTWSTNGTRMGLHFHDPI